MSYARWGREDHRCITLLSAVGDPMMACYDGRGTHVSFSLHVLAKGRYS